MTDDTSKSEESVCVADKSELLKRLFKNYEFKETLKTSVSGIVSSSILEVKEQLEKQLRETEIKVEKQASTIFDLQNDLDKKKN